MKAHSAIEHRDSHSILAYTYKNKIKQIVGEINLITFFNERFFLFSFRFFYSIAQQQICAF